MPTAIATSFGIRKSLKSWQKGLCASFILYLFIGAIATILVLPDANAQVAQETFGKNRLQYKNMNWQYITTANFDIYYYQGEEALSARASEYAEQEFVRISELLGFSPYRRISLYLYASRPDIMQSNVGLDADNNLIGGRTNFSKSIVEIPYAGSQVVLKQDIALGIAQTLIAEMMYGGSFKDMVQNSYLLTLPEWYLKGAALYATEGWSSELDNYMRDAVTRRKTRRPGNLLGSEAEIIGQSIWNYIALTYGKTSISNILNLTRIVRNEENAISNTLGIPYDKLISDWRRFYSQQADASRSEFEPLEPEGRISRANFRGSGISQVKFSRAANRVAWVRNNNGKYTVETGKTNAHGRKVVFRDGFKRLNQYVDNNPIQLSWGPGNLLYLVTNRKGAPWLFIIDGTKNYLSAEKVVGAITGNYRIPLLGLDQVNSIDVAPNGKSLVLSADLNGQTDLYLYNLEARSLKRLNTDFYDDATPVWLDNTTIAFSSNRLTDTLSKKAKPSDIYNNYNLFLIRPYASTKLVRRLTNSPFNETQPRRLNHNTLVYTTDEKGIKSLSAYNINTKATNAITDYGTNINSYDVDSATNALAFTALQNGRNLVFLQQDFDFKRNVNAFYTRRQELQIDALINQNAPSIARSLGDTIKGYKAYKSVSDTTYALYADTLGPNDINIRNYVFETEKKKPKAPLVEKKNSNYTLKQANPTAIKQLTLAQKLYAGPFPYHNRIGVLGVTSNVQIDPLLGWGVYIDANLTDQFENHKFKAGGLIITDLKSHNIFAEYQYLKHRFDFKAKYHRKAIFSTDEASTSRYVLDKFEGTASYPLTPYQAFSGTAFIANTTYTPIISSGSVAQALALQDQKQLYSGIRLQYTFDNTVSSGLNMLEGTRIKAVYDVWNGNGASDKSFRNIYADVRHYQSIHKELVFAIRGAAGKFYGNSPKTYSVGGMDNWLFNSTNQTANKSDPLGTGGQGSSGRTDWLFLQYATNVRGFVYNTQFGNNFALLNAELRLPIVRYLYKGPISSNFLKHFQLIAFYDAGCAWSGASPLDKNSSVNTRVITQGPLSISVIDYKNPILQGYGAGLRTMMLGYYLKVDVAQGVKDYATQPLRFYLTLGYDF